MGSINNTLVDIILCSQSCLLDNASMMEGEILPYTLKGEKELTIL